MERDIPIDQRLLEDDELSGVLMGADDIGADDMDYDDDIEDNQED